MIITLKPMVPKKVLTAISAQWGVGMTRAERDKWGEVCIDAAEYKSRRAVKHHYLDKSYPQIYIYDKAAHSGINSKAADFGYSYPRKLAPLRLGAAQDCFLHPAPRYIKGSGILISAETTLTALQAAHWFVPKYQLNARGRLLFGGKFRHKGKVIKIHPTKLLNFAIPKPECLDPKKYKMRSGFIPSDADKPLLTGSNVAQRADFLIEKVRGVRNLLGGDIYDINLAEIKECELYFELAIAYACGEYAPVFSNPSTTKMVEVRGSRQTKMTTPPVAEMDIKWEMLSDGDIHQLERERAFEMTMSHEDAAAWAKMTYNERHRKQLLDGRQSLLAQIEFLQRERPDTPPEYLAMLKDKIAITDQFLKDVEAKIARGEKGGGED